MTAGLGIEAFHMARRAASVTAIEMNPPVAEAIEANAATLRLPNVTAVQADCREWLEQCRLTFDTIFIDPARRGDRGQRLYSLADCQPTSPLCCL